MGGPADLLFQPADADDLALFLQNLAPDVPVTVVGVGSNLLVRDGGVSGVVIRLSAKGFGHIVREAIDRVRAGGAALDKRAGGVCPGAEARRLRLLSRHSRHHRRCAPHERRRDGGETRERLIKAYALDRKGARQTLTDAEMGFAYRHTSAPPDLIFTEALFQGTVAAREDIHAEMIAVERHREAAQPIREKTGGSTFVNPEGPRLGADRQGRLPRLRIGGAMVSEMHCNFLINTGTATATDLERLGETVRARVLAASGVRLEWERGKEGGKPRKDRGCRQGCPRSAGQA